MGNRKRNAPRLRFIGDLIQDVRIAARAWPRQPAALATVVITMAVGIAGTVATFAVVDAAIIRALPYPASDRLVLGRSIFGTSPGPVVSAQDFEDYRERVSGFEALGAIAPFPGRLTLTGLGDAERLDRIVVSHDFFEALGVDPIRGRHFSRDETRQGGPRVVMLAYEYWQRRFDRNPDIVGTSLTLNGVPHDIVGVMPAGFRFYLDTDVWSPYQLGADYAGGRGRHNFLLVGRLASGRTLEQVQAEADAVSAALELAYPDTNEDKGLTLTSLQEALAEPYVSALTVLVAAAVLILLVACANVAGVLTARGAARRSEIALRSVMGAGRGRLVRQLLTENALVAGAAAVLGTLLGLWLERAVLAFLSLDRLGDLDASLSAPTLAVALAAATVTVLLAGLAPALRAARIDPAADLRAGRRSVGTRETTRFRGVMVVTQIALTSVLLVASGLLLRSFMELQRVDLGFDARSMLTAEVQVAGTSSLEERIRFPFALVERLNTIPGIRSVAVSSHLPVRDPGNTMTVERQDDRTGDVVSLTASQRLVLPGYFAAMGIPLVAGRDIQPSDRLDTGLVIVLGADTARRLFDDEDPIGRDVLAPGRDGRHAAHRVVGIVADVVLGDPAYGADLAMYQAHAQLPRTRLRLGIRVAEGASVIEPIRAVLRELDPDVPLDDVRFMDAVVAGSLYDQRTMSAVLGLFATTALVLASVGLYGLLAYQVSLRRAEIGVRMALGASSAGITAHVVRGGLTFVAGGLVLGGLLALVAGKLMSGMLFGVHGSDPATLAGVVVVLGATSTIACLLPARRAAAVSPVEAMRAD